MKVMKMNKLAKPRMALIAAALAMSSLSAMADCANANQGLIDSVKEYAANGQIDNYVIEKYGHGDNMAVIITKKAEVSPGNQQIGQYISALVDIRLKGCSLATHAADDNGRGAFMNGQLTITNTLLCSCSGAGAVKVDRAVTIPSGAAQAQGLDTAVDANDPDEQGDAEAQNADSGTTSFF